MNYPAAKNYIVQRLTSELPPNLYYHGLHHTFDVHKAAKQLADSEKVTGEELTLLKTAALFHDAGFIQQYQHNEPLAVKMIYDVLPQFDYTQKQIDIIKSIIMATSRQEPPQTLLQKIICDADLDYLGRADFYTLAAELRKELSEHGINYNDKQWNDLQIKFLENHCYYTVSAIEMRNPGKLKHLDVIKGIVNCNREV